MNITRHTTEAAWLADKLTAISASESPALFGASGYASPFSIFERKRAGVVEVRPPDEMQEAGHRLEPVIAKWFGDLNPGLPIHNPGEYTIVRSGETPCMACTPDRLILSGSNIAAGTPPLELKCSFNYKTAALWKTHIPPAYQIQLHHQMYCLESSEGWFAVLCEGYRFTFYKMNRNERFVTTLVARCSEFWDMVQSNTPPPVDFHSETRKALSRFYDEPTEVSVDLDHTFWETHEQLEKAKAEGKRWKKLEDEASNRIKAGIGNATIGVLHDCETAYRWSKGKSRRLSKTKVHDNE